MNDPKLLDATQALVPPASKDDRPERGAEPETRPHVVQMLPSHRPEIVCNNRQLHSLTAGCIRALHDANNPPVIFSQGMNLVRVVQDGSGRIQVRVLDPIGIRSRLAEIADFVQAVKGKGEIIERYSISPPLDLCQNILAQPRPEFPPLQGATHCPVMNDDRTVVLEPGYDSRSGLDYDPGPGLEKCAVPEKPTECDIREALEIALEALLDFPFADDSSLANALGLLMTIVLRALISGLVPLALINAPKNGSGKGLLTGAVSQVATGQAPLLKTLPGNDEETRKTITATLQGNPALLCFDNVEGVLASPVLAAALTMPVWTDRLLGVSRDVQVPSTATWIANGNNVQLGGDLPRRCYEIRLDPKSAFPYIGREYKHPRLIRWVEDHRSEIVGAILTLARGWIQAGRPSGGNLVIGSFESWCETIGGILHFAGVEGFLSSTSRLYEEANLGDLEWEAFLLLLRERYGDNTFTAGELVRNFDWSSVDAPADIDATNRSLGTAFAKREDTRYGESGAHLVKAGTVQRAVRWKVVLG